MINQISVVGPTIERSYLHQFQTAQRNLELVCEEYKGTQLCKKQYVWRERKGHHRFISPTK